MNWVAADGRVGEDGERSFLMEPNVPRGQGVRETETKGSRGKGSLRAHQARVPWHQAPTPTELRRGRRVVGERGQGAAGLREHERRGPPATRRPQRGPRGSPPSSTRK